MAYQSEAELEQQLIKQLGSPGGPDGRKYERVSISDYAALEANFKVQFAAFNAAKLKHPVSGEDRPLTDKEWERVFNKILGKSIFESAKILRDKFVLERDDGTKVYLRLFDGADHTKNIFQVAHQTTVVGKYKNRYDVTILVNGLPLVQIELKRRGIDIREAFNQIMRYRRHSYNGLYHFIQIFVVSNGVDTKYFANSDRDIPHSLAFFWTDFHNRRLTALPDFTSTFLAQDHITKMIADYMILNETDKLLMVMRPYQVYAAEALVRQATETDRNAYVWHTTGAGKTLTSFKTAQILATNPSIKKVIFLVDRKDLDSQTTEEFNKFENGSVDATDSTNILVKQMRDKNRKLIITTIQKMATAIKRPWHAEIMDAYKDEKVVFIVDECHRSQFGDMHKDIRRHFQRAQFFGFTGTPRFEVNGERQGEIIQTTEMLFGECVHRYLIKDAIFDNNVLGFHVEYIKTMEGNFDWDDPAMVNAINIQELYKSEERMTLIAEHIVKHHKAKTWGQKYTAIFAVASVEHLVKYYDIFKNIEHDLSISGIFSYGQNEESEDRDEHSRDSLERIIKDYNERYGTNFSTDTFAAYHKDISDRMKGKKAKQLDILLVVDMFLTGFDSKKLATLYLDKDLKYHGLLQAYSRTNRVEKETKPFGNIVCYRNLKKRTDEALALFSNVQDGDDSDFVVQDYDHYVEKFNETAAKLRQIADTPAAVDVLQSEEAQKSFVVTFRELTKSLQSLEAFIEFNQDEDVLIMSEQDYQDYKSKYLMLYARQRTSSEQTSVLDDVDFCIELMESDRINVDYIMNLIRNIRFDDAQQKDEDIAHIKNELRKADNPQLLRKVDLLRAFLDKVVAGLSSADEIDAAYNEFEHAEKQKEIATFAQQEDLDPEKLTDFVAEYEFSGTMNEGHIRDQLVKPMWLPQKRPFVVRIVNFIKDHVAKYQ